MVPDISRSLHCSSQTVLGEDKPFSRKKLSVLPHNLISIQLVVVSSC